LSMGAISEVTRKNYAEEKAKNAEWGAEVEK
jgi:hypothetical protein